MHDKQDFLRNLLISGAVFLLIVSLLPRFLPPPQPVNGPDQDVMQGDEPRQPVPDRPAGGGAVLDQDERSGRYSVAEAGTVETVELGAPLEPDESLAGANALPYRLHLHLINVGAAVDTALSSDHAESLDTHVPYELVRPVESETGRSFRSLTVERINLDGETTIELGNRKWHAAPKQSYVDAGQVGEEVRFWIDILRDDEPIVRVTRRYRIPQQDAKSNRYDVYADIAVENLDDREHRVVVAWHGGVGTTVMGFRGDDRVIDVGVVDQGRVTGTRKAFSSVSGNDAREVPLFSRATAAPGERLSWAATANNYFTCTVAPTSGDGQPADYISAATAIDCDGLPVTQDDVTVRFVTSARTVAAGGSVRFPCDVYLGPKLRSTFKKTAVYSDRNFYYQISQGFGSCTFTWLVELMLALLDGVYSAVGNYGIAIIVLVFIVRGILHPITKRQQIHMVRVQHRAAELAPKMEEIKRKHADDPKRMQQEMLKLQNPLEQMMGCLPMLLQIPIWIALWVSLNNNIAMRHEGFMLWINDLTSPDALIPFSQPLVIPLVGWTLEAFNLLPFLLAISMYVQQKLMPKPKPSPSMTDQQKQQQEMMQKMMPLMSVFMLVIFYKMPSGLTLYILASNVFGTIEQIWIRRHIREREEAGTLHKPRQEKEKKAPGVFHRWLEKAQQAAEEAKRDAHKGKKS